MNWVVIKKDPTADVPRWDVVSVLYRIDRDAEQYIAGLRKLGAEIGVVDIAYAEADPCIRFPEEEG